MSGIGAVPVTDPSSVDAEQDKVVVLDDVEVTAKQISTKNRPGRAYDIGDAAGRQRNSTDRLTA